MKSYVAMLFLFISTTSFGYETDQFSTPSGPLADLGDDLTAFVAQKIQLTLDDVNYKNTSPPSPADITESLAQNLGDAVFSQEQRDAIFGLSFSIFSYESNSKDGVPITFTPSRFKTIYSYSGFHRIISSSYFVMSSTIRAFDIYFGVDKLGHFFTQRMEYLKIFNTSISKGDSEEVALANAVAFGVKTENRFFGMISDGVYSNGDLAANVAGFYFYKNLFEQISLDGINYASLLVINSDGSVSLRPEYVDNLNGFVAKFFSQHLNEAFNPSHIEFMQRPIIRRAIRNRCERLNFFYNLGDQRSVKETVDSMSLWHQVPYGHNNANLLRLDEICFPAKS
ncbi:hypothetical protein WDW86_16135 [Bdellovibrionota bacterium FG-2]